MSFTKIIALVPANMKKSISPVIVNTNLSAVTNSSSAIELTSTKSVEDEDV